jgi:hypothetical protein
MTNPNDADIRSLTDAEITAVAGGANGSGASNGDGVLQQVEGVILGGLGTVAKAAGNLASTVIHMI